MDKNDLENRTKRAIIGIEDKVSDIRNILYDMSMKLCHIIKSKRDYYGLPDRDGYYK